MMLLIKKKTGVREGHTIHVVRGAANRASEQAAQPTTQRNPNSIPQNAFAINPLGLGANLDQDVMRSMMNSPTFRVSLHVKFINFIIFSPKQNFLCIHCC